MVSFNIINFSKTLFFRVSSRRSSTFQPVQLAYVSYENASSSAGKAPVVVKHGLFGSKSNWNSLCKVYHNKTHRKIIAVDTRNHGDSPHVDNHNYEYLVADLVELYKTLGISKAALIGHSMGGRAVMLLALKYPELVERLIVVDISPVTTSPNLRSMPTLFEILQSCDLPKNISLSAARNFVDSQLAKAISDKSLRNFLLTNLVQKEDGGYSWRVNIPVLMKNFEAIARFPEINENLKYSGPILFIGGEDSDYIQKSDHPSILKLFPNAEFKYVEDAGHWVHSEKPIEFLEHTVEFLNREF